MTTVTALDSRGATRRTVLGRGVALSAAGAALLAACGAPSGTQGVPAASAAPYKLVMGNKFGGEGNSQPERLDWMEKTHAEFNRVYGPKLTVEHIVLNDLPAHIAALASNTGPDVFQASGSWFS